VLGRPRRRRPYSLLPYVAIGATYALLVVVLMRGGLDARAWGVLGAAIISTGLVVVRQLAAFTENARLLTELDGKVHELNETEEVLRASLRERDDLAAELRHLAFHDSLTGLPNRALFVDRVENALARARRHGGQVVVLLLDLDDFKPINDHFGHAYGDELLKHVGERLRQCLRDSDTAARLGGDEFGGLLEEPIAEGFVSVAERIVRAVKRPYVLDDEQGSTRARHPDHPRGRAGTELAFAQHDHRTGWSRAGTPAVRCTVPSSVTRRASYPSTAAGQSSAPAPRATAAVA